MKKQKFDLIELSLIELPYNEVKEISGGSSAFTTIGYWIGRGLEVVVNGITNPTPAGAGGYPESEQPFLRNVRMNHYLQNNIDEVNKK